MLNQKALAAALSTQPVFVEDVMSTYLYTGNGSTQTITNGIDLAGYGGLVWIKSRNNSTFANSPNVLTDSVTGLSKYLISSQTSAQQNWATDAPIPTSNGFNLPINGFVPYTNYLTGSTYASWTFRKQAKFFDVVTYTGNGVAGRAISHSLGSVPGCIILKSTSQAGSGWKVWHRAANGGQSLGYLETTLAFNTTDPQNYWGNNSVYIAPTSTTFTISNDVDFNNNGSTYVAYLFAHDAGGFGTSGSDNVISCGSFNNSLGSVSVTLGWEPQWIMFKKAGSAGDWSIVDNMRGMPVGGSDPYLSANLSAAENSGDLVTPTATGFITVGLPGDATHLYIAIRRGPMKTPTSGTSVFAVDYGSSAAAIPTFDSGFAVDMAFAKNVTGNASNVGSRLTGATGLTADTTNAETAQSTFVWDSNAGWAKSLSSSIISWMFRRAPGFFDVVCYTGNAGPTGVPSSNQTINHNLTVAPELIITKNRSLGSVNWTTWNASKILTLNTSGSAFSTTTNYISTVGANSFVVNNPSNAAFDCNASGDRYVAYLFATCAGVSKVGSYTGNGSNQTINCGFTGGSRFVLIKRTDSTGDWYVWDSARGIVAGNDPHLSLNTTAAEVTTDDSVDTDNSGFIVNQLAATNINVSSATYIFLAIA